MEETKRGYLNTNSEDDLIRFFLEHKHQIPDQRYTKGAPPQPGIPCPKCALRNRSGIGEAYEADQTPIGHTFKGSKRACEMVIERSKKQPHEIDSGMLNTLVYQNGWEEEHVAHVIPTIEMPGIITFMAFKSVIDPSVPLFLCYLVDGTHRAVAALRAGREFWAYVLTPKESLICLTHIDGQPNPYFLGAAANTKAELFA